MICNICEKESVCKLIDGSDVVKCAEFLGIKETDYKMTSDDCISRQGAIDALGYNVSITSDEGLDEYRTVLKKLLWKIYDVQKTQIEALPSIQPKPKTGHWIGHREHCENLGVMPSGLGAYEWCSNCDCGIDVKEWHRNNYNYCPNCGAKMVEPQESEDI